MKNILCIIALAGLALATGCEQKAAFLTLNPDGSGTLRVRYSYDESAGNNPANPPEPSPPGEQLKQAKETVEEMAARMGAVTFVSGKAITNAKGWPGYEGTYSFTDVNQVMITFVDSEDGESVADMKVPLAPKYAFTYTPGDKLEISAESEAAKKAFEAAKIDPAKWTMMKGMFNGARETVMVKLPRAIKDTNADFVLGPNKDTLLLFDFEFEKITDRSTLDQIEALRRDKGAKESLHQPGVRMQNPMKKVTTAF